MTRSKNLRIVCAPGAIAYYFMIVVCVFATHLYCVSYVIVYRAR